MKKRELTLMGLPKKELKKLIRELKRYGFETYADLLNSHMWAGFRDQMYIKKHPVKCEVCKQVGVKFHLHHISYKRIFDPDCVRFVCPLCHEEIHQTEGFSIQHTTDMLSVKIDKRALSERIVKQSGLPETLHHSIFAYGLPDLVRRGMPPKEAVEVYRQIKIKKNDKAMLDLLSSNAGKVYLFFKNLS